MAVLALGWSAAGAEQYTIPLFPAPGASGDLQGVLRIVNDSGETATVQVFAFADDGTRSGPATIALGAMAAEQFDATELQSSNAARGLSGGLGSLSGDVRLSIDSDTPIVLQAFVRASDGTLSAMHDTVRPALTAGGMYRYEILVFNLSTHATQESRLRLINPGTTAAAVTIAGRDNSGTGAGGGDVTLSLPAGRARTLTAEQLEAGGPGLTGTLGAGIGRWRLTVSSDRPLRVVNVGASYTGHWNNLSTTAVRGAAPADLAGFNERFVGQTAVLEVEGGRSSFRIMENGRFSDSVETGAMFATSEGDYDYVGLGPDAGRLTLDYDDGSRCRANLYFSSRARGWFSSHCRDGTRYGGNWFVGEDEDDGGDGGPVETTFGVDMALPGVPTSGLFDPAEVSGGNVRTSGGSTTIDLNDGGYIELNDGARYACVSAGGCEIVDGTVTRGSVTGRAPGSGGGGIDRIPILPAQGRPGDRTYTVGTTIDALTLPQATGGDLPLTYSLSPDVPGLRFDAAARRLSGTPTEAGSYAMSYTATDADGDQYSFYFTIAVRGGEGDDHGDTFDTATSVSSPSTTQGELEEGKEEGDRDYFRVVVATAITLTVETTGRVDTYGTLFDGGRTQLATNDDGGSVNNFQIERQVQAGTYYVEVRGYRPSSTGSYELRVSAADDRRVSGAGDRAALVAIYEATDGANWANNDNWLTDAPLEDWHGVHANPNNPERVAALYLQGNQLKGPLPPELGNLADLQNLWIQDNALTGRIPPELGNLTNLRWLWIDYTGLTGPIPPELGMLSNLEYLYLGYNNLSGPIPPELGALARLRFLDLASNELTGRLPVELGNLNELQELELGYNHLAGQVPPEFRGMANLKELGLANNPQLQGVLPVELSGLAHLKGLIASETSLCAPSDPGFQAWLSRVYKRRVAACDEGEAASAYLVQAVQSRAFPVPLVAGERALLRVFPTASRATDEGIPLVRARFFLDGLETHVETIRGKSAPIPTEVDESSLSKSANATIPGEVVQPGLEMVIDVDPEGTLDPALQVTRRIPETGRLRVDVAALRPFQLTLIPFLWEPKPDSRVLDIVEAMVQDPDKHELLRETRTLLPIEAFALTAHEPVTSSSNGAHELSDETEAIRILEGGRGYYMGTITGERGSWHDGLSDGNSYRTTFAALDGDVARVNYVIAHELGHNLRLDHTPGCDAGGIDGSYPYIEGRIGVWGYDFNSARLVPPRTGDLMSYCSQGWISDYHFTNALRFRLFDEGTALASATRTLLVWGGVSAEGDPWLEPTFLTEAPAVLPRSPGDYRLSGHTGDGGELFSFSFTMSPPAHGDGRASFAFALPVRAGWEDSLASITLTGPGGSVILDDETNRPMTILRNPNSGQVRGILRGVPPPPTQAPTDAEGPRSTAGFEVLFSRGVPGREAWRR